MLGSAVIAFLIALAGSHCVAAGLAGFLIAGLLLLVSLASAVLVILCLVAGIQATIGERSSYNFWFAFILASYATFFALKGPNGEGAYVHFETSNLETRDALDKQSDQLQEKLIATGCFTPEPRTILGGGWMLWGKAGAKYENENIVCQPVRGEIWITINCSYYDLYSSRNHDLRRLIKAQIASLVGEAQMASINEKIEVEPWLNLRP
jgi:uncharacterized membrane protein